MSRLSAGKVGQGRKTTWVGIMTVSTEDIPGRIFMSYRREDTAYPAAWLFDRLSSHFGRKQIFKDVDSIELGEDFVQVITAAVESCDVLLALIGGRWLTIPDQDGRPRLDNPGDFVRLEIEAALARNVRVIPILVDGARMPRAEELPASLAHLARRQALELSPVRFDADTQRLLRVLDRVIDDRKPDGGTDAEPQGVQGLQEHSPELAASGDINAILPVNDEIPTAAPVAAAPGSPADAASGQIIHLGEAQPVRASTVPGNDPAVTSAWKDPRAIHEVLAAMVKRGGQNVQAVFDGLIDLGYSPGVPALKPDGTRQLYLGWSDPARADSGKTKYTLYLEARIVSFGRVADRRKVADLPGADTSPGAYVAFRLSTPDTVDRALAAARAVKY